MDRSLTYSSAIPFISANSFSRFFRDQFQLEFYVRRAREAPEVLTSHEAALK